jgi:hypothetical protein
LRFETKQISPYHSIAERIVSKINSDTPEYGQIMEAIMEVNSERDAVISISAAVRK